MQIKTGIAAAGAMIAALGLMTSSAIADAPPASKKTYAKAAPAAAPAPESYQRPHIGSWSGLYFGGNVGYAWGNVDWQYVDPAGAAGANSLSPSGATLGGHVGLQHQYDRFVVGVEVSYSGGFADKIEDRGSDSPAFASTYDARARINSIFTVGPRLGFTVAPDWLVYGTGGWASAQIFTADILKSTGAENFPSAARHDGWFLGAGVERQLHDRWIIGLEYLHMEFDTHCQFRCEQATPTFGGTRNINGDVDMIRARISFKLGRDDHKAAEALK